MIPVSCLLDGDYGFSGVYAGVPAVICSQGVRETVGCHLTENELEQLHRSLRVLQQYREGKSMRAHPVSGKFRRGMRLIIRRKKS